MWLRGKDFAGAGAGAAHNFARKFDIQNRKRTMPLYTSSGGGPPGRMPDTRPRENFTVNDPPRFVDSEATRSRLYRAQPRKRDFLRFLRCASVRGTKAKQV